MVFGSISSMKSDHSPHVIHAREIDQVARRRAGVSVSDIADPVLVERISDQAAVNERR